MRRAAGLLAIVALCAGLAACGDQNVVTPGDVAGNYVYAIAEGNFSAACALLDPHARAALIAAHPSRGGCPGVMRDCLPSGSRRSSGDQSQLLYANTDVTIHGNRASVALSATPAASATRLVHLIHHQGRWRLSTPGVAISRCLTAARHHRRAHHG